MLLKQNEHLDARAAHGSAASRSTDETHWWTYDGVYSEKKGRGGVRSLFFFFLPDRCREETEISRRGKREGSGMCGSSGRRMNNSQKCTNSSREEESLDGGGEDETRAEQEVDL